jgi:RNA polymerase sigma-70 factor (ECF subfamily)
MNPPGAESSYTSVEHQLDAARQGVSPGDMQQPVPRPRAQPTERALADDAELLRRMSVGDESALGEFYDRWSPRVHALVFRLLRDRDDAEDVVEEVFWQAWRQAARYEPARGSPASWLLSIARTRTLDRLRTASRRREAPLVDEPVKSAASTATVTGGPVADVETAERRTRVLAALGELPAEQREALELAYYEGLSQTEIADRTGQPLGTVKTRTRLALQKLRERLSALRERGS